MTSFMALDGVTSFLRLKDVTITCKRTRRSLNIGGSSSVQWRKVGRSWRLRMRFRRLLCALVIWSSLQLTSNSELLLNNSLLELIYFLNNVQLHKLRHFCSAFSRRHVLPHLGTKCHGASHITGDPGMYCLRTLYLGDFSGGWDTLSTTSRFAHVPIYKPIQCHL